MTFWETLTSPTAIIFIVITIVAGLGLLYYFWNRKIETISDHQQRIQQQLLRGYIQEPQTQSEENSEQSAASDSQPASRSARPAGSFLGRMFGSVADFARVRAEDQEDRDQEAEVEDEEEESELEGDDQDPNDDEDRLTRDEPEDQALYPAEYALEDDEESETAIVRANHLAHDWTAQIMRDPQMVLGRSFPPIPTPQPTADPPVVRQPQPQQPQHQPQLDPLIQSIKADLQRLEQEAVIVTPELPPAMMSSRQSGIPEQGSALKSEQSSAPPATMSSRSGGIPEFRSSERRLSPQATPEQSSASKSVPEQGSARTAESRSSEPQASSAPAASKPRPSAPRIRIRDKPAA
jgi:hypothetical protein